MTNTATIYRETLSDAGRINYTGKLFGTNFPMKIEPAIYSMADMLAANYDGGFFWDMFALSNDSFYMAPRADHNFAVSSMNGFEGSMTADAFGITVLLFCYSHLSFGGDSLAEVCAEQFHLLREYALSHPEVRLIMAATD